MLKKPLKEIFRRLTDDDVRKAQANPGELLELVMLRYGLAREQVEPMMASLFANETNDDPTDDSLDEILANTVDDAPESSLEGLEGIDAVTDDVITDQTETDRPAHSAAPAPHPE